MAGISEGVCIDGTMVRGRANRVLSVPMSIFLSDRVRAGGIVSQSRNRVVVDGRVDGDFRSRECRNSLPEQGRTPMQPLLSYGRLSADDGQYVHRPGSCSF